MQIVEISIPDLAPRIAAALRAQGYEAIAMSGAVFTSSPSHIAAEAELAIVRGEIAPLSLRSEIAACVGAFARSARCIELAERIFDLAWGAQPDGCFVAIHSGAGHDTEYRYVHAPHRRGIIASVTQTRSGYTIECRSDADAWARQRADRAKRAAEHAVYLAALRDTAQVVIDGGFYATCEGQNGGTYTLPGRVDVSARGAHALIERMRGVQETTHTPLRAMLAQRVRRAG